MTIKRTTAGVLGSGFKMFYDDPSKILTTVRIKINKTEEREIKNLILLRQLESH